jgi:hypothetical protein
VTTHPPVPLPTVLDHVMRALARGAPAESASGVDNEIVWKPRGRRIAVTLTFDADLLHDCIDRGVGRAS